MPGLTVSGKHGLLQVLKWLGKLKADKSPEYAYGVQLATELHAMAARIEELLAGGVRTIRDRYEGGLPLV